MMSPMHHPRSSRVRIMDVAVAAGVSIGTVSNTLNHPERVTAETRERVMAAVLETSARGRLWTVRVRGSSGVWAME